MFLQLIVSNEFAASNCIIDLSAAINHTHQNVKQCKFIEHIQKENQENISNILLDKSNIDKHKQQEIDLNAKLSSISQ